MLSFLRRALKAFIGPPVRREDPPPQLSDNEIIREYFRAPPVPVETKQTFQRLTEIIHEHLDQEVGHTRSKRVAARLKAGVEPLEALSRAIEAGGMQSIVNGVAVVDWKAREELQWMAHAISKSHGLSGQWMYDWKTSSMHEGFEARDEIPVEAPLRDFASWMLRHGLTLFAIAVDDSMMFFAIRHELAAETQSTCEALRIKVVDMTAVERRA